MERLRIVNASSEILRTGGRNDSDAFVLQSPGEWADNGSNSPDESREYNVSVDYRCPVLKELWGGKAIR